MPAWSMDDWLYLQRQVVTDPKGRAWTVALMDLMGQEGDPEIPASLVDMQQASGRYFTLIYSSGGSIQYERGHASLADATEAYERLLVSVFDGTLNPAQPVFRTDLED